MNTSGLLQMGLVTYMVKTLKSNELRNQKVDDIETCYVGLGIMMFQACSYDDPSLTLTYLTSM